MSDIISYGGAVKYAPAYGVEATYDSTPSRATYFDRRKTVKYSMLHFTALAGALLTLGGLVWFIIIPSLAASLLALTGLLVFSITGIVAREKEKRDGSRQRENYSPT